MLSEPLDEDLPPRVTTQGDGERIIWRALDQERSTLLACLIEKPESLVHSTEPRVHYRKVKWGDVARQSDFVDRSAHGIQDRTLRPSGA